MDKIQKFLKKLTKKDRDYLINNVFPRIVNLELSNLDVKKLKDLDNLYRVRHKNIRIVFSKGKAGNIAYISFRKDINKR
ncbi:hypothetical protein KKG71_06350 [Patescibacteria group bacterium]|nr:hypothetical protein [Patescibacteria group bacterium]